MKLTSGKRIFLIGFLMALLFGATLVVTIIWRQHKDTGEWSLPSTDSMVRITQGVQSSSKPSRTIYLHRGAVALMGGTDDAPNNISSIVGEGTKEAVTMPGFSGSNRQWRSLMKCTRKVFAPFDVVVTDALPLSNDYIMVAVGGKVSGLHLTKHDRAAGLAPFSPTNVIPKAVVFGFSDTLKNNPRTLCDVVAMEVGHAYGLDHSHNCKDAMTYLKRCGARSFTNSDSRCGEKKARDCANGEKTQNSRQHLLNVVGASRSN